MERPRLRQARLDRGWSQSDLAEKIETTWRSIHNWEMGFSTPYTRHIHALCEVFGCKPEDIDLKLYETPPKPPNMTKHPSHHFTLPDTIQNFLACCLLTI